MRLARMQWCVAAILVCVSSATLGVGADGGGDELAVPGTISPAFFSPEAGALPTWTIVRQQETTRSLSLCVVLGRIAVVLSQVPRSVVHEKLSLARVVTCSRVQPGREARWRASSSIGFRTCRLLSHRRLRTDFPNLNINRRRGGRTTAPPERS